MCLSNKSRPRGDERLQPSAAAAGAFVGTILLLLLMAVLWARKMRDRYAAWRATGRAKRDEERGGASEARDFVQQRLLWFSMGKGYRVDMRNAVRDWRAEQASETLGLKMYQKLPGAPGGGGGGGRRGGDKNMLVKCPIYKECGMWFEMPSELATQEAQSTKLYAQTLAMDDFRRAAAASSSSSSSTTFGLAYRNLSLTVGGKKILRPMQGIIQPGRLTAVLGASGCGKSSFIAALTGRAHAYGTVRGEIYIRGGQAGRENVWRQGDLRLINDYHYQDPSASPPSMWGASYNSPEASADSPPFAAAAAAPVVSDALASRGYFRGTDRGTVEAELRTRNQPMMALVRSRRGAQCTHAVCYLDVTGKIVHLLVYCDPKKGICYGIGPGGAMRDQCKTLEELVGKYDITLASR